MPTRGFAFFRPTVRGSLYLLSSLAFLSLCFAAKPWETKVFQEELLRREISLRDYITAGVWLGTLCAAVMGLLLAFTSRWWNTRTPAPLRAASGEKGAKPPGWFLLALAVIVIFAGAQRWPAMKLSFWGDEGWAFCDFVHGKWKPVTDEGSPQDDLRFDKVKWRQTVFGDRSGNNHWLASILQRATLDAWQKLTGREAWAFDERIVRLVPLTAGLASLAALAFFGRRLGGSVMGLTAAALMALHPLHVRFSVEARGYSLMLLFIILALWMLLNALEFGRKRDWALFGVAQFLVLYSWKGAIYPLAFLNLVLGLRLLFGPRPLRGFRATVLSRWFAANLLGAILFFPLTVSSNLQIAKSIDEVRRRAKPMNEQWARDAVSETVLGAPWHEQDKRNPREVSLERLRRQNGLYGAGAVVVGAALLLAMAKLWRRDRLFASLGGAILVSGLVATLHFKYVLRVELLTWYLLFNVPIIAMLLALAVPSAAGRFPDGRAFLRSAGAALAVVALFALFTAPMRKDIQTHPREDHQRAWELTRGRHEARGYAGPSVIHTGWLWRHTHAYDPRGDTYVRTGEALRAKMAAARASGGEFYMVAGMRDLCEMICGDVMKALRDPSQFDPVETLWGVESLNTLEIYRMRNISDTTPAISASNQ